MKNRESEFDEDLNNSSEREDSLQILTRTSVSKHIINGDRVGSKEHLNDKEREKAVDKYRRSTQRKIEGESDHSCGSKHTDKNDRKVSRQSYKSSKLVNT